MPSYTETPSVNPDTVAPNEPFTISCKAISAVEGDEATMTYTIVGGTSALVFSGDGKIWSFFPEVLGHQERELEHTLSIAGGTGQVRINCVLTGHDGVTDTSHVIVLVQEGELESARLSVEKPKAAKPKPKAAKPKAKAAKPKAKGAKPKAKAAKPKAKRAGRGK